MLIAGVKGVYVCERGVRGVCVREGVLEGEATKEGRSEIAGLKGVYV